MQEDIEKIQRRGDGRRRLLFASAGTVMWAGFVYFFAKHGTPLTLDTLAFAFALCMAGSFVVGEFLGWIGRAYLRSVVQRQKQSEGHKPSAPAPHREQR